MKRNSLVGVWTLLVAAGAALGMLQCEAHSCTAMGTQDHVSVTVVSAVVGSKLPEGAYDLVLTVDDTTVRGTWHVDEAGLVSDVSGSDGAVDCSVTPAGDNSGSVIVDIRFDCPAKKLSVVEGVLSKDGSVIDDFSFVPTYDSIQPTEDNGEGCGECYRMTDAQTTLTVP